jgi:tetratricopeptide (TPR) repeat protein
MIKNSYSTFNCRVFLILFCAFPFLSFNCSDKGKLAEQYLQEAIEADKKRDHQLALSYYDKAIELNPQLYQAYCNRGLIKGIYANSTNNFYKEALDDFSKAIELKPQEGEAYFQRGIIQSNHKNHTEGCKDLETAMKLGYGKAKVVFEAKCK